MNKEQQQQQKKLKFIPIKKDKKIPKSSNILYIYIIYLILKTLDAIIICNIRLKINNKPTKKHPENQ